MHQQENWGRARIIRAAGDEGNCGARESFSIPSARNMLITFGHRRQQPSGVADITTAGIRVNNAAIAVTHFFRRNLRACRYFARKREDSACLLYLFSLSFVPFALRFTRASNIINQVFDVKTLFCRLRLRCCVTCMFNGINTLFRAAVENAKHRNRKRSLTIPLRLTMRALSRANSAVKYHFDTSHCS